MKTKLNGILTLFMVLVVQLSFAQEKTVTGTVKDEDGMPLPGVNVIEQGTNNGVQTDFDGIYKIDVEEGAVLSFSYVGFGTKTAQVGSTSEINITMIVDAAALDEVVVTGYGSTSKRNVTTAISQVDADDAQKISVANISAALQGNSTGVQVTQSSGAPGGEVRLRVRGATSVNGSNSPLYIVDGVQIESGSTISDSYGGQQNSALSSISSSDIESIEVLKDAAAAAIYGSRASNGVVIITTKRGKSGKPKVSINSYVGIQNPIEKYETMNYGQWLNFSDDYYEASQGSGYTSASRSGNSELLGASDAELQQFYNSVTGVGDNYMDAIYRDDAVVRNITGSISGGTDGTQYYLSGSSYDQEGVILGQDYHRDNFTMNLNQDITDKFRFTGGATISSEEQIVSNGDNNIYGVLSTAILESPGNNIYNEDGTYNSSTWQFSNPVQNALLDQGNLETFRLLANAEFTYDFTDWLSFSSKYGLDNMNLDEKQYNPSTSAQGAGTNGYAYERMARIRRFTTTQALNFDVDINDDISFTGLLAGEYNGRKYNFVSAERSNFASPELQEVSQGATVLGADGSYNESKLYSLISRASFNLYGKYIITGSLRADGSSKFGENEKWGYFPSISGGYILSEEDWFDSEAFNFVKLRASYGVTGNDTGIGAYDALAGVSSTPYAGSAGTAITEIGNPDVKWEVTSQFDIGFSLGLFNNVISVEYDYFDKKTDDLLLNIPLAYSSGFSSFYGNVGEMSNRGHEVSLDVQVFDREDFSWRSSLGFSTLDNKVTSLDGNSPFTRGFASRVQEGEELGAFYVLESDGLYQEGDEIPAALAADGVGAGDVKYIDQNGDGIINDSDYIIGGSPWADFTASWTNNIQYKNFDLYFLWAWSEGNDVFNSTLQYTGSAANPVYGKFTNQLNYWTPDNTNTNTPRPNYSTSAYNNYDSTRLVEDGSFIKLRNVTLGYTLPKDLLGFGSIRFYASADNLLMFTDYSGIDPEVNYSGDSAVTSGTDFLTQGGNKVYKFGVNINF